MVEFARGTVKLGAPGMKHGQTAQYNFILVVGENETKDKTVTIRCRSGKQLGTKSLDETLAMFCKLRDTYDKEF